MEPLHATLLAGLVLVLAAVVQAESSRRSKYSRLPPGPKPSLLYGNKIRQPYPWRYFYELSQTYGPLVTVWIGRSPSVICSNVKTADDLLEKQARDSSDRPRSIVGDEIFSNGKRILLVGYNERWRRLRKALHHPLQPESAKQFRPVQEKGARNMVLDILEDPQNFQNHIKTYAATIVVNLGYGRTERARYSDPDIKRVIEGADRLGKLLRPPAYLVESFPFLRYIPGYLKTPTTWAAEELALFREAMFEARRKIKTGETQDSFVTFITQKQKEYGLNDDECAYLCGSIFGAGSDTSSSAITICVMAAAMHLDVQKKAQEQLDQVVGRDRLPNFEDWDALPYVKAFVQESYRWRPVSSGGFQHRTTADIAYDAYFIPAGTTITGNHWAIHRDKEYYGEDVETFRPERWLNKDGSLRSDMRHFQFGFGRRVCPGQHIANQSVFVNAALLLWAFDITKARDPTTGKEIDIDTLAFTNTANSHPLPFQASFTPRVANLQKAVEAENM